MGKNRLDPLRSVHFHCKGCGNRFEADPQVEDAPDQDHHPYNYSAECQICGGSAGQAAWERNLMKAHANATGPKTDAGKLASAANLDGHPTPEESLRTRFNAMTHGLSAKVATYFPAKPGHYPACDGCEHLESQACTDGPRACLKRMELFLNHQIAFDTQDPKLLMGIRANTQAAVQALIDDMILAIAQDGGPRIKELQWFHDKDGGCHVAGYFDEASVFHQIREIKAHPLLKPLMEFISKNAMTLADLEMTPKVRGEQEILEGFLDREGENKESSDAYQQRMLSQQEKLMQLVNNSYQPAEGDVIEGEILCDQETC